MKRKFILMLILLFTTVLVAQDGTLKWRYQTGWFNISSSPAIGTDGTIYVGSWDRYIYAINSDGTLKWRYQTGYAIESSPAIGSDGTVYIGSSDNYIYAINQNSTLKWRYQTGNCIVSSPAIGTDHTVYVGSYDKYLYSLSSEGTLIWKYQTGDWIDSSPAIGCDGTVYFGNNDHYLYALNADGTLKWRYQTEGVFSSSPAIGKDGTVYIGSEDGYLNALNSDGTLKWKYQTEPVNLSSPAIDTDGTVYVGSWGGYLYALNSDGTLKWRYQTRDWIHSSPAIGTDGTIYVGSNDNYLYALNSDGTLKWKYQTGSVIYSSPAIGTDGTIYVGSNDWHLYAISNDCGGLAGSVWPMRGGNLKHTGRYPHPFYYSFESFTFQPVSDNYSGIVSLFGSGKQAGITSCQFSNPVFSLNTSLPFSVAANQTSALNYTILPQSAGIYTSTCTLGWHTDENSGDVVIKLSQGLIPHDGSEADIVGIQVLAAYDSSYVKDPKSIATKNNEALLYRICGDPETADQILAGIEAEALQDCYCSDVYLLNRGVTRSDLNQPDTAAICYNGILGNDSEIMSAKAWYNCGWEAYHQADYDQVISYTDSVIADSMVNDYTLAKAWCLRGAAFRALRQWDDAGNAFEEAKALDPDGPIGDMARANLEVSVDDEKVIVPSRFVLYANYPNPFNPSTNIVFDLPEPGVVTVSVYNTLGQRVSILHQGRLEAGQHTLQWNARDDQGRSVGSGIYLLRVSAKDRVEVRKMTLMR